MTRYKHIFFDLDGTLWDFDRNSSLALLKVFEKLNLADLKIDSRHFINSFKTHNDNLWGLYRQKKVTKSLLLSERFRLLFQDFNIDNENLVDKARENYSLYLPSHSYLIDGAKHLIETLCGRFKLYIVSNGFIETQLLKLKSSSIDQYFNKVFTSDIIGCSKPDKRIFEYAVKSVNARKTESIFVGDDLTNDIQGAKTFGIDQVWFNPQKTSANIEPTYEIEELIQLIEIVS